MEDSVIKALRARVATEEPQQGSGMEVHTDKVIAVTAKELKKACESNPSHPAAKVYLNAVKQFTRKGVVEDIEMNVHAVDLQALLDNKSVEVQSSDLVDEEDSQTYKQKTKVLGAPLAPEPKISKSTSPPATTPSPTK